MVEKDLDMVISNSVPSYPEINSDLSNYMESLDSQMNIVLHYLDLPAENVVASVKERKKSFNNLEDVISEIDVDKSSMIYLSRYIYATSVGLFDAALNYLWDATINELRKRVKNFNVEYFYDVVVQNTEKRAKLHSDKDLPKLQDSELISGAHKIEMIDSVTYQRLSHILYMRNWTSSAHPNDHSLTGLSLIDFLETCITSVFNLPMSELNLEIQKLLADVKESLLPNNEIEAKKSLFDKLTSAQHNSLLNGLFGIFVSSDSTTETKNNITKLAPLLWSLSSEETKTKIGTNYGNYSINSHTEKANSAKKFIEIVEGQSYIPQKLKMSEISNILSDLSTAHSSMNNFYAEPSLAQQLSKFVGDYSSMPEVIEKEYVETVVNCFLTNGFGSAWNAEQYYREMINAFTDKQARIALLSFKNETIKSKIDNWKLCSNYFKELLNLIRPQFVKSLQLDLLDFILNFNGDPLGNFVKDTRYLKTYADYVKKA